MDDKLPPPLDLLWGTGDRRGRGPRQGLSVERIVRAAIELADADGLEAVSMSRVAERLGFTTMSLYRHVESKEELLVLMVNEAIGEPGPSADASHDGWRPGLERWSYELLAVLERHPWGLRVPIGGPPTTPSQLAWLDRGLGALAGTALSEAEKAATVLLLNGYVFWMARLASEMSPAAEGKGPGEGAPPAPNALISGLVDAERFPALRRALDAGIFDDESGSDDLSFGLGRILDGVALLVRQRAGENASSPTP